MAIDAPPAATPSRAHGPALHGAVRAAVYVLGGLGAIFSGVLAMGAATAVFGPHQAGFFSVSDPDSLAGNAIQAAGALGLFLAGLGGIVGLALGREWGRLLLTYACGFWAGTLVFLPVAAGLMFVLWHPHLPERPGQLVERVLAGLRDHRAVAGPRESVVAVLLGVTTLVFILHESATLLTDPRGDSVAFVASMAAFTFLESLVLGAAIIGVGRKQPWGRPVAIFAFGMCLLSFLAYPLTLVALFLLLRPRAARPSAA